MRTLLTGWFTFHHGEATAGDLLAAETVSAWLTDAGIDHDVASSPAFAAGPMLDDLDPAAYDRLVFACGPAAGWQVDELLEHFAHCRKVAVGVSIVDGTAARFDEVVERDSDDAVRPDLALLAPRRPLPAVVAVVRSHAQPEYPTAHHDDAHAVIDAVLADSQVSVVEVGTRVDPNGIVGRWCEAVESVLCRADAVVTTRLHGLVLALRHGVPAVAVDPVAGGAKITRQSMALGWPAVVGVDDLAGPALPRHLEWALTEEARAAARRCVEGATQLSAELQADVIAAVRGVSGR